MNVITTTQALQAAIDELSDDNFVTIDTEFLREKTYYPLLCLVQVAGENHSFAIDTLESNLDLSPLWQLLSNHKVTKVFHACQQDVEIFLHHGQNIPEPLMDTQIAAQIMGYGDNIGYGNLVDKICNIQLDKSSRHTDWSKRPLSDKQISYAMSDVTHLRDVYIKLMEEVTSSKRENWLADEISKIKSVDKYLVKPENAWKKLKIRSNSVKYISIVKQLSIWREEYAQKSNKPRNWILKNDAIFEIASIEPETIDDLKNLRFYSNGGKSNNKTNNQINQQIIQQVKLAAEQKTQVKTSKKTNNHGKEALIDLLKVLLKSQAKENNVSPTIIASANDIEQIAYNDLDKCKNIPAMNGWRYEVFGKIAQKLKNGDIALFTKDNKIDFIEI